MRNVKISYKINGEKITVEGVTVGKRKSGETAVMFVAGDTQFIQWYPSNVVK